MTAFNPKRLRSARQAAGIPSMYKLARALETSERNVARWEGGHNAPRGEMLVKIAALTGKPVAYFYGEGDDDEEEAAA